MTGRDRIHLPPADPPLPPEVLRHYHLLQHAADEVGAVAVVPVTSLSHLLLWASTAAEVLDAEELSALVTTETDHALRAAGRHLAAVEDEPGPTQDE